MKIVLWAPAGKTGTVFVGGRSFRPRDRSPEQAAGMHGNIFVHDQFLGMRQARRQSGGFAVSWLVPTVPEHEVAEHAHAEAHFVLLLDGAYISSARDAPELADRPLLIYNPPGTTHRDRFRGEGGAFMTVAVSLAAQQCFDEALDMPAEACALAVPALRAAQRIAASRASVDAADGIVLESLCADLMLATATQFQTRCLRVPAWLRRARDYLRDMCTDACSLSDVAAACGVHPVYLARAFRQHFGCSPGDYLRRCRLNRAAALLTGDGISLAEVAADCGYCDQAHFSRAFAESFGVPPGHYRRQRAGT